MSLSNKFLFILLASISGITCTSIEEPSPAQNISINIAFDPEIERFEGGPGDELTLVVRVEIGGDANEFYSLVLERIENGNHITSIDTLAISDGGIPSPFEYGFRQVLNEQDINKDFQLRFTASTKNRTPSGGTVFGENFRTLGVRVLPPE